MRKYQPDQVIAIANCGLPLGAVADYLGYEVKIIDAHCKNRVVDIPRGALTYQRSKEIKWLPDFIEGGDVVGVLDVDELNPSRKTVILDDFAGHGQTLTAVYEHLKEMGIETGKIVLATGFPHQAVWEIKSKVVTLWKE